MNKTKKNKPSRSSSTLASSFSDSKSTVRVPLESTFSNLSISTLEESNNEDPSQNLDNKNNNNNLIDIETGTEEEEDTDRKKCCKGRKCNFGTNLFYFGRKLFKNLLSGTSSLPIGSSISLSVTCPLFSYTEISGVLGIVVPLNVTLNSLNLSYNLLIDDYSLTSGFQTLVLLDGPTPSPNYRYANSFKFQSYTDALTILDDAKPHVVQVIIQNNSTSTSTPSAIAVNYLTLVALGPAYLVDESARLSSGFINSESSSNNNENKSDNDVSNNNDNNNDNSSSNNDNNNSTPSEGDDPVGVEQKRRRREPICLDVPLTSLQIFDYDRNAFTGSSAPENLFVIPPAGVRTIHLPVFQKQDDSPILLDLTLGLSSLLSGFGASLDFDILRNGKSVTNQQRPLYISFSSNPLQVNVPFTILDKEICCGPAMYVLVLFNNSFSGSTESPTPEPISVSLISFTATAIRSEKNPAESVLKVSEYLNPSSTPISFTLPYYNVHVLLPKLYLNQKNKLTGLITFSNVTSATSREFMGAQFDLLRDDQSIASWKGFQLLGQVIFGSSTFSVPILWVDQPKDFYIVASSKRHIRYTLQIYFSTGILNLLDYYFSGLETNDHGEK